LVIGLVSIMLWIGIPGIADYSRRTNSFHGVNNWFRTLLL